MGYQLQNVKQDQSLLKVPGSSLQRLLCPEGLLRVSSGPGCTVSEDWRPSGHHCGSGAMALLINSKKSKEFRWHDSGDVQDEEHLLKIFAVAKLTPQAPALDANA